MKNIENYAIGLKRCLNKEHGKLDRKLVVRHPRFKRYLNEECEKQTAQESF